MKSACWVETINKIHKPINKIVSIWKNENKFILRFYGKIRERDYSEVPATQYMVYFVEGGIFTLKSDTSLGAIEYGYKIHKVE